MRTERPMKLEGMSNDQIIDALANDGYIASVDQESVTTNEQTHPLSEFAQILRASAAEGCLVWNGRHIVSTHSACPFELTLNVAEQHYLCNVCKRWVPDSRMRVGPPPAFLWVCEECAEKGNSKGI